MMKRMLNSLYPFFYRVLMSLLVLVIAVATIGSRLGLNEIKILHWVVAFWIVVLLTIVGLGKFYQKVISVLVLAVSMLVMVPLMEMAGILPFYDSYFLWLGGRSGFQEEWLLGYELMQMGWMTLVCSILWLILEKNLRLRLGTAILMLVGLVVGMLWGEKGSLTGMAGIMSFLMIAYTDYMRSIRVTKKRHDQRAYLLFLTPFIVLYFVVMNLVPIREVPYDWKTFKDIYHNLREKTITLWENITRNTEEFDGVTIGFSDEHRFSAKLEKTDRQVMTVRGDYNLMTDIYLRGKTYDRFADCRWQEALKQKADEYPIDMLELVYGVRRYDKEWEKNYIKRTNLEITFAHFNTVYAFAPGKLQGIYNKTYEKAGDIMRFRKEEGYGTAYEVSFFQMNYGVPEFDSFVENVADLPDDADVFEEGVSVLAMNMKKSISLDDLYEYREAMQNQYCEDIILSPQIQQYIDKVTEGCTTQWQRLKAIEKSLRSMRYTVEPGAIPKSVKTPEAYLDYFLLESRKGYCAHFATAFVLLARAEGLPARYVEGFRLSFNASRTMRVYNSMAHAWPEVYLEGVGWVTFEPTPGYSDYAYAGWQVQKADENAEEESTPIRLGPTDYEVGNESEEFLEELNEQEKETNKQRLLVIGFGILVLLGICLTVFMINLLLSKIRYLKKSDTEKFMTDVRKNLWLLEKLGFKRLPSETLDELEHRILKENPHLCDEAQRLVFLQVYQEYVYRLTPIEEELLKTALTERKQILKYLKEENVRYYVWICLTLLFWVDDKCR